VFEWAKVKTDEALKAICGGCFNIVWIFLKIFYERTCSSCHNIFGRDSKELNNFRSGSEYLFFD